MFGPGTLTILVVLLVLSIVERQTPLFLLSLALLLAGILSQLWERYGLVSVEYRRHFTKHQAEFGETIDLEVEIVNRKLLPLAWLEVEDEIPKSLHPTRGKVYASHKYGRAIIDSLIPLRPYERVRRHYPILCTVRGEHLFGPTRLRTGDLFGLVTRDMDLESTDTLVVYPRVVPLTALGLPAHQPLGDQRIASWIFEDPSRVVGVREYSPRDSIRRIHWGATARTQRLQVKVYEATTSHRVVVFLNLNTTSEDWWSFAFDPDVLELSITTAASLAAWALGEGYAVGLVTNGMHRLGAYRVAVETTSDPTHLPRFLEALGRLQPFAVRRFDQTLAEEARRLPYGVTVVVVTAGVSATVAAELLALRRRGHPVTVILTGRGPTAGSIDGILVHRVGPPDVWHETPALSFVAN